MKNRKLFVHTAIAGALVALSYGAQAGSLSGSANYALELFGSGSSTVNITAPALVYTFSTPGGIVLNPSGNIYAYFRLNNGAWNVAPTTGSFAFGGGLSALSVSAVTVSTDKTTARVTINNPSTTSNVTIGVGGTLTLAASDVTGASTVLTAADASMTAQTSIATTSTSSLESGSTLPADLDGGLSAALKFAIAKQAITSTLTASSAFTTPQVAETQKVDLTATSPGSRFTTPGSTLSNANSTTLLNLGSIKFTDVAGVKLADGTTDYTIAGRATATGLSGTVTGTFKTGTTGLLTTDAACTTGIAAGSAGALNVGLTTLTFTGGTRPATATANYVCMVAPATTGAIPVSSFTGSFSLAKTAATDLTNTASGALYTLTNNGQTVDIKSYIPAGTTGYTSYIRVVNSGAVDAAVTGQWLNQDGTTSTAATLGTVKAGGSITWTSTNIEAALGAPSASANSQMRPRLRLTAPTNGLQAQSFFSNPDNSFSIMHGGD